MKITKESLKDEDNLSQCECGNWTHQEYITMGESGDSCPVCHIDYQDDIIAMYKKLLRELADPALSIKDIDSNVKLEYCKMYGIGETDFDLLGIENL